MGLGLKIPCLLRVVIPVGEEGGGGLFGLREAGPIEKGEEGRDWWTWIRVGLIAAGLIGAGPVGEEGKRVDCMGTGLREAGPVGEREDGR